MQFELNEETFTIRGRAFVVRELSMDDVLPITDSDMTNAERSKHLIQAAVTIDGAPIEDAGKLPAAVFNELSLAVVRVNGLADDDDDEGGGDAAGNA